MRVSKLFGVCVMAMSCQSKAPSDANKPPGIGDEIVVGSGPRPTWPDGVVPREAIEEAWRQSGLKGGALGLVDAGQFGAKHCAAGKVAELEVLICAFADEQTRASGGGAEGARAWAEGARTLLLEGQGATLLAVADRTNIDPRGVTLERVADTFRRVSR